MGIYGKAARRKARRKDNRAARRADARADASKAMPGPSSNAATNLLITDVAVRGLALLMRRGMERSLLSRRLNSQKAEEIVQGRTWRQTLLSAAVSRLATRSVPGLLVVGSGLLAKAAFDRSRHNRSLRKGHRQLEAMADNAPED